MKKVKNISSKLMKTAEWEPHEAKTVADLILAGVVGVELSWDEGAGEDWISITEGSRVVGFVHVRVNLVLLQEVYAKEMSLENVVVISFREYDGEPEFKMDSGLLESRLGVTERMWGSSEVEPNAFTPGDLVFMTV